MTDLKTDSENRTQGSGFGLSKSMWEMIQEIKPPEETPVYKGEGKRPASVYISEERYQAEKEHIFNRVALPIMMSSRLPDPMSSIAHDGYGVPLLFTRDREGVVRAFINGCRHRGAKILDKSEAVSCGRLTCPYHAWTYGLDGKLIGISRHDVFPSLSKQDLPLIELHCFERGGLIWAGLDPTRETKILPGTDEVCKDLDAPGFRRDHIYGFKTFDLPVNWKLVTEAFLEGYHAPRLHAPSVGDQFLDVKTIYKNYGPHSVQLAGRKVFDKSLLEQEDINIHRYVTSSHIVFPNTSVVTSPYYTSYMIFMPRGKDRTWVEYYMMTDGPPDSPKAEDLFKRSYDLILKVFADEDFKASGSTQASLATGLIPEVYFGGLEPLNPIFHDNVEKLLPGTAV